MGDVDPDAVSSNTNTTVMLEGPSMSGHPGLSVRSWSGADAGAPGYWGIGVSAGTRTEDGDGISKNNYFGIYYSRFIVLVSVSCWWIKVLNSS